MKAIPGFLLSNDADPLVWTLGPILVLTQIVVFVVAWQRVHHGGRLTPTEFLADVAPLAALAGLLLAHPFMVMNPESSMPLVVAYGFLAAVYATFVYGSLGRMPWGHRGSRSGRRGAH